ncbi:MAG TPA: YeeE/YedE family protein, partial [Methylococcales bacterium]|nr:YeeE/YedE family protein [Methylococcales bacterium]
MENFTPYSALFGGILIGLGTSLFMLLNGRIAGISGLLKGLLSQSTTGVDKSWRAAFIIGLVLSGLVYQTFVPIQGSAIENTQPIILIIGGLLVGFGTAMGSGCTSGHGVCGLS